ncbi:hypothetical protein L1276_001190 [Flavobacterium sp. HSC-32F16]|uniref:hypothetical protein n=1 Tax=Flavobacterium sp. HSC-32F16 TaxID=2910964 RepID=UPI0020A26F68|nr:hypothetical protein [Flavobacterium sp. HSC-32F16]MCP2026050.1 hypothetical protein [Flavobacterium sp. HSC-32F16]
MGTFSQTNIKCKDLNAVIGRLKKYLPIGREIWLDTRKEWFYNLPHEENSSVERNITIIVSQNQNKDWVEVEFDFNGNLYFYDEILRRISKELESEILLGYYQSTDGEGRLAKFKNGQLELSFYEKYFYYQSNGDNSPPIDRIYVADNFGVAHSAIESLKKAKLGEHSYLTDHEFIYEYYKSEGWKNDLGKDYFDWTYLHLEQIK